MSSSVVKHGVSQMSGHFHYQQNKNNLGTYEIHDYILENVHCANCVHIDLKLTLNTHDDANMKKANSTCTFFAINIGQCRKVKDFLARNIPWCCRKVKQMAYTAYIRPIVEYASPVLGPHTKRNTNKIEMVQRRCAGYVSGNFNRTSSVTSLLNCLSWPTLEERWHQYRLAVMHRILHNQVDIHWQSFSPKLHPAQGVTAVDSLYRFARIISMPLFLFLVLVKTGITITLIQLMHHPLTPLPGS